MLVCTRKEEGADDHHAAAADFSTARVDEIAGFLMEAVCPGSHARARARRKARNHTREDATAADKTRASVGSQA